MLEITKIINNFSQEDCDYVNGYSSNVKYRSLLQTPAQNGRKKIETNVILAQQFYKA